jgi:hypothetical protein
MVPPLCEKAQASPREKPPAGGGGGSAQPCRAVPARFGFHLHAAARFRSSAIDLRDKRQRSVDLAVVKRSLFAGRVRRCRDRRVAEEFVMASRGL